MNNNCRSFLAALIQNLETRFGDEKDDAVFEQLKAVFGKNKFPLTKAEVTGHGIEELHLLLDCFSDVLQVPIDDAESEYRNFKFLMRTRYRGTDLQPIKVCKTILKNEEYRNQYPILAKLTKLALVLPCHTVDVERVFSKQNLIKNKLRASMKPDTLQMLMQVSIEGPPIHEFPFDEDFEHWAKKSRRIFMITS